MTRSRKKQPYRQSRAFDPTCRNHGSCPWCADGRQHKHLRRAPAPEDERARDQYPLWVEDRINDFWRKRDRADAAPPDSKTEALSRTPEQNS